MRDVIYGRPLSLHVIAHELFAFLGIMAVLDDVCASQHGVKEGADQVKVKNVIRKERFDFIQGV